MDTLREFGPAVGALAAVAAVVLAGLALAGVALERLIAPGGGRGGAERAALVLGLGLAGSMAGGLALNLLPWGLSGTAWIVALAALLAAAALRGLGAPARPGLLASIRRAAAGVRLPAALPYLGAALLLAGAYGVAWHGAATADQARFSQLWALEAPDRDAIEVGVRNAEGRPMRYRLELAVGGRTLAGWPEIALEPGVVWRAALPTAGLAPAGSQVEARLYLAGEPAPYRRVTVQLGGDGAVADGQ